MAVAAAVAVAVAVVVIKLLLGPVPVMYPQNIAILTVKTPRGIPKLSNTNLFPLQRPASGENQQGGNQLPAG